MPQIEDIIFLGAGASASEGAPLQGALFRDYFQLSQSTPEETHQAMNERLSLFFSCFFRINTQNDDLNNIEFPTFEECLGILELALNRQESFKGFSLTPDKPDIQRLREDLIFLIAIILNNKLRMTTHYHRDLITRLKNERKLLKTAFISSNYDILIDNALIDLYEDFDLDYSVEFTNFSREQNWARPRKSRAVKLFKIHGSLNWLYCPTCISLMLTPKEKKVASLVFAPQPCPSCHSNMVPIVIPPSFFKVMSNFFLQEIWRQTEVSLKQAKRIFFCGYSFPDADIHIKYLLKRAEMSHVTSPEVYVINHYEGKLDSVSRIEESRYKRFFKNDEKVYYTTLSFQDFCLRGTDFS